MVRFVLAIILSLANPCYGCGSIIKVPRDHYLGISEPCPAVASAREMAVHDVAAQVLRTIGASYSLTFESRMTGTADKVKRSIEERFHYSASGFVSDIENHIVSESCKPTPAGFVCEVLVHYPKHLVKRMRRLSGGAKVVAVRVGNEVELRELNGVSVVLTLAEITVSENYRHAGFLSYYVMKVGSGSCKTITRALREPVILQNNTIKRVPLMVPTDSNPVVDAVLGTKRSIEVVLVGTDEVGRAVRVPVVF